ncbi:MAG TPA: tetratricopeptide repeat protein [Thermomicrobiales bacterium]|nr:tetratricopeptide repeat protein [Thermomicrobiales bacterium]
MSANPGQRRAPSPDGHQRPDRPPARPRRAAAPPKRRTGHRAKVAFSVIGLAVTIALALSTLIFSGVGFGGLGGGSDNTPTPLQANLVPTYQARLQANPKDLQALLLLANIDQNNGDYADAIDLYQRAVEIQPNDLETRLAFGQALANYGQSFDAEVQYQKALTLDPNNPRTEFYLGQLYERWDPPKPNQAREHYQRASQLQPEGTWGQAARDALQRLDATPSPTK